MTRADSSTIILFDVVISADSLTGFAETESSIRVAIHNEPAFSWAPVYAERTIFVGGRVGEERRGLYAIDVPF